MNLGRNQLLAWINQITHSEYSTIEMLSDGVAFCQVLEALHPGAVNLTRLNLSTRYPDDCLRNLRILESGLKKLRINQPASFEKISQGKFHDNIMFLQWLYSYSMKNDYQNLQTYPAYNRRLQIIQKQGKSPRQINPHLVPNQALMSYQQSQRQAYMMDSYEHESHRNNFNKVNFDGEPQIQSPQTLIEQKKEEIMYKVAQLKQDAMTFEGQLKTQMETNWKLMHNIERSIQERNTLYSLLKQIQTVVKQSQSSSVGSGILSVICQNPDDFA